MTKAFVDTNVLLYTLSSDTFRAERAEGVLRQGGVISVQVLNEYAAVARGKYQLPWNEIVRGLNNARVALDVLPVTVETHDLAIELAERLGFRIFDSLLLAAALLADCDVFWSEDLQHNQVIEGRMTVQNPFI